MTRHPLTLLRDSRAKERSVYEQALIRVEVRAGCNFPDIRQNVREHERDRDGVASHGRRSPALLRPGYAGTAGTCASASFGRTMTIRAQFERDRERSGTADADRDRAAERGLLNKFDGFSRAQPDRAEVPQHLGHLFGHPVDERVRAFVQLRERQAGTFRIAEIGRRGWDGRAGTSWDCRAPRSSAPRRAPRWRARGRTPRSALRPTPCRGFG